MSTLNNLLAGLGGAIALNILHETFKRAGADMPRIDKLGEEALQKGLAKTGNKIDNNDSLYRATLGADILSNTLYYSTIGAGNSNNIWPRAVFMGASAGIGAVTLPKHMGLDDAPVARTSKTKALTVGYYLFGALVTGCILKKLNKQG